MQTSWDITHSICLLTVFWVCLASSSTTLYSFYQLWRIQQGHIINIQIALLLASVVLMMQHWYYYYHIFDSVCLDNILHLLALLLYSYYMLFFSFFPLPLSSYSSTMSPLDRSVGYMVAFFLYLNDARF